ncbi:MAG: UDP-N-acetylmuramoyl-tripeptide--D-alanyl-D-alanine ligase, partial [Bacteroidales bacterium]|nr:UDP-N-acetylmuramoyl-tripeptide--D-alanyl-D-alanine ligase [Bacteroidales bacterium]
DDGPYLGLRLDGAVVKTRLVGAYNAANVLAAIAVGDRFGVPRQAALKAIAEYEPSNKRSQLVQTGRNTLVVDAYNANPSSMMAAIDNFARLTAGDKVALLGDMRELGAESQGEHEKILVRLQELGLPAFLVGEEFSKAVKATGFSSFTCFDTSEALASFLSSEKWHGRTVLIKGSRGIRMENVLKEL